MLRFVLAVALVSIVAAPARAQTTAPSAPPPAQAYFEFMLARRLEAQGDTTGALAALERAQTLDPRSAEIFAEMAGFHARQNDGDKAIAAAEKALTLDANNTEAHRMLGLVYSAMAESGAPLKPEQSPAKLRSAAIEHLSKIQDTPAMATDLNLQLTLGRLHLRVGRPDRAAPIFENVTAQAPFAAEPYALLGEARRFMSQPDAAIAAYERAAEINPRNNVLLAELYEQQGRWSDAIGAYERALANPRAATREIRLRYFAALLNGDQSHVAKARDGLKDFLVATPQDARGLLMLSRAHLELGDIAEAESTARLLIKLDPTSIRGLHALTDTYIARRDFKQVVTLLTPFHDDLDARSKGRESDAAVLLSLLAHAHLELGDYPRAVSVLQTAIARDPLSAPALNSLGYTLADRGERLPEAVALIERALKVEPNNPSYLDSLGWALFKQGKPDAAEPHLKRAADARPQQSVIQDHYGDVLARQGKLAEAIGAWERALAGDGEDVERAAIEKKIRDARGKRQ
jgi:tetratricopeptide (TPR) repeat protein